MLSKKKIKLINQLRTKKGRKETGLFIAEGVKLVSELLNSKIKVEEIYTVDASLFSGCQIELIEISETELRKIGGQKNPNKALCIAQQLNPPFSMDDLKHKISLVLDGVNDPGNLGTILRTADWFGIENVVCSHTCVELYNPKVVQSTMGSLSRVKVHYMDMVKFIEETVKLGIPLYGTMLEGGSLYETEPFQEGAIVFGNEANGINSKVASVLTHKIKIPSYGEAESLNVAISAAIVCAEIKRWGL